MSYNEDMKDEERKEALRRRNALDEETRKEYSRRIVEKLKRYIPENARVLSYRAYGTEADLSELHQELFEPAFPKVTGEGMNAYVSPDFEKGAYGIEEPQGGIYVSPESFDVILVPLVAFDERKNRLGHGKGYYDRYLKKTFGLKVGIAFEAQKRDSVTTDENDVKLDLIVTEEKVYF